MCQKQGLTLHSGASARIWGLFLSKWRFLSIQAWLLRPLENWANPYGMRVYAGTEAIWGCDGAQKACFLGLVPFIVIPIQNGLEQGSQGRQPAASPDANAPPAAGTIRRLLLPVLLRPGYPDISSTQLSGDFFEYYLNTVILN